MWINYLLFHIIFPILLNEFLFDGIQLKRFFEIAKFNCFDLKKWIFRIVQPNILYSLLPTMLFETPFPTS